MGTTYSFMRAEKRSWISHNLRFDSQIREETLKSLSKFENGQTIYLSFVTNEWGGLKYNHWFITDKVNTLEFGGPRLDIYEARVTVKQQSRTGIPLIKSTLMNEQIRDRMRHVAGMSNYSLCLRNCEHVANYVFRGKWISSQMDDTSHGVIIQMFKSYMLQDQIRLVNTFPSTIRPHVFRDVQGHKIPMYSFIDGHPVVSQFDYYLDYDEPNTYNVLVVGPTGAGKSHLMNVLFNQKVCESEVSHRSVTREIYFLRGRGPVFNLETKRMEETKIIVADTVGLCDTEWEDTEILNVIKGRISANYKVLHAVIIVFKADRLLSAYIENIKMIMKWLKYTQGNNYLRFWFIGTYAESLSEEKKDIMRQEATEIFSLPETNRTLLKDGSPFQSLQYVGFPPEETLNELTKKRVMDSWKNLNTVFESPGNTAPLKIPGKGSCNIL